MISNNLGPPCGHVFETSDKITYKVQVSANNSEGRKFQEMVENSRSKIPGNSRSEIPGNDRSKIPGNVYLCDFHTNHFSQIFKIFFTIFS